MDRVLPPTAESGATTPGFSSRLVRLEKASGCEAAVADPASWQVPHQKSKIDGTGTPGKGVVIVEHARPYGVDLNRQSIPTGAVQAHSHEMAYIPMGRVPVRTLTKEPDRIIDG